MTEDSEEDIISKMEICQENENVTTEIIFKEENSESDQDEEDVDINSLKKLKLTGRLRELDETLWDEAKNKNEEEYSYCCINNTSLKQFLKQFDKAILKGLYCSTEIHCNTNNKERLRNYLKECYGKKKIDTKQLIKLCKNVFYLEIGTNNCIVNIYLHKHNARRYIYQFCNQFFNEKTDSYLTNKYVPRSYL